jgi:hypothetical protein
LLCWTCVRQSTRRGIKNILLRLILLERVNMGKLY